MSKAPFTLHCIVCFEAFNLTDRPPVILPCGHTFICSQCSKRLETCMECRTPLKVKFPTRQKEVDDYDSAPPSTPTSNGNNFSNNTGGYEGTSPKNDRINGSNSKRPTTPTMSWSSMRTSQTASSPRSYQQRHLQRQFQQQHYHQQQQRRNTMVAEIEPIQLPTPKNLVLMSLMEAGGRAITGGIFEDEDDSNDDYESGDDDDQVITGMKLLSRGGSYGTYVIKEPNGLTIHNEKKIQEEEVYGQKNNRSQAELNESTLDLTPPIISKKEDGCVSTGLTSNNSTDDVIINSSNEHLMERRGVRELSITTSNENENNSNIRSYDGNCVDDLDAGKCEALPPEKPNQQAHLMSGQTLQVVNFNNGIAKLARGRGYVYASDTQIVKVGDPVDEACKVEGILSSLSREKERLQNKLTRISLAEKRLSTNLIDANLTEEGDPFAFAPGSRPEHHQNDSIDDHQNENDAFPDDIHQPLLVHQSLSSASHSSGLSVASAPNHKYPGAPVTTEDYANLCQTTLETLARAAEEVDDDNNDVIPHRIFCGDILLGFSDSSEPSLLNMAAPKAARRIQARSIASSRRSRVESDELSHNSQSSHVDFRTGLSGHMSLASPKTNMKHSVAVAGQRGAIRMMGEHKGASKFRTSSRNQRNSSLHNPIQSQNASAADLGNSVSW